MPCWFILDGILTSGTFSGPFPLEMHFSFSCRFFASWSAMPDSSPVVRHHFLSRPYCQISCIPNGPDLWIFLLFRSACAWMPDRHLFSTDSELVRKFTPRDFDADIRGVFGGLRLFLGRVAREQRVGPVIH